MKPYSELLRDPRWQKKRLYVMSAANFRCEDCGDATQTLEIHHCAYIKGREPWEYEGDLLMCLCEHCHEKRQKIEGAARISLARFLRCCKQNELEHATWEIIGKARETWTANYAEAFS